MNHISMLDIDFPHHTRVTGVKYAGISKIIAIVDSLHIRIIALNTLG